MHCTCTTHKTCHLSLKSAGQSVNPYPRNTEIQRCPLMAAASFQVALQKQQCPHGKWLGTGISCKSVHLYGYLVKTFDENVHDVSNARIVFGNLLLQKKPLWIHCFPQERMDRWWSVLIWSRASDDHDSSWICNLQIPKLMTFTDSVNNGKTGVLPWNWNWGDNSPILIIFHLFFLVTAKKYVWQTIHPKITKHHCYIRRSPLSTQMQWCLSSHLSLVWWRDGWKSRWDFPLFCFSSTLNWSKSGEYQKLWQLWRVRKTGNWKKVAPRICMPWAKENHRMRYVIEATDSMRTGRKQLEPVASCSYPTKTMESIGVDEIERTNIQFNDSIATKHCEGWSLANLKHWNNHIFPRRNGREVD